MTKQQIAPRIVNVCAGSRASVRAAFDQFVAGTIPMGVEAQLWVRGRHGGRVWQWLWRCVGQRLARRAGFEVI